MRQKYEILDMFLNWKNMIETKTGKKIKQFKSNEYKLDPFTKLYWDENIVWNFTIRETPATKWDGRMHEKGILAWDFVICKPSH